MLSSEESWKGEKGFVDGKLIKKLVPDYQDSEVYICGPPPMMKGLVSQLRAIGVDDRNMHYELFSL